MTDLLHGSSGHIMYRISAEEYFMGEAFLASQRSNCIRRKCGAVFVKNGHVIATGYNGTPSGMVNCFKGGCERCNDGTPAGQGYDRCLCVHSEENCVAQCARLGTSCDGATCYVTMEPCFGCLRIMLQAGIKEIIFGDNAKFENEDSRKKLIEQYNYEEIIADLNVQKDFLEIPFNIKHIKNYRQCKTWKPVADAIANISLIGK